MIINNLHSRIAPTPSGFLHIGNVFSFVLTRLLVSHFGGTLRLRIDDLDAQRMRPEYLDDIFQTLQWIDLQYDAGASGVADFLQNFSQQNRMPLYLRALEQLQQQNDLYTCTCSRSQWQGQNANGLYPQHCRNSHLPFEQPETAWRVAVPDICPIWIQEYGQNEALRVDLAQTAGDFVIRRRDNGQPAYQLACVIDDHLDEINFVVRGADLLQSTACQLFLAEKLQLSDRAACVYLHHGLVKDEHLQKMSKSHKSLSIKQMREQGFTAAQLYGWVAQSLQVPQAERVRSGADLLEAFGQIQIPYNTWHY
ncbi:glutamyl-tRNA synthetase [Flexibacter flexilis DSM 6793]|uniref:Glutamyl-tRNA synthetase n=1 Tax=Flexibacter flexilis DSM 6793 TaxID=927664 RepID=A0A1I1I4Q1_9BACT|nr:glutamate--tRNA ligase family protein [Flexibacter flexilis]SFC31136.1 glutamyl-tRNA synthetase [Flexibacter flexilis DSM 6793]